jgi:DNA-binding transcriptional LysR family regulator
MNYTLHQLQVFLKITQLKSVTKAAEQLHLTQPAVSIQLKNFQNQFSIPLTEVVGRQLFVTDFGQEIAQAAQKILDEVEAINYKTLAYQGELSGKLKISIVSTAKYAMPYFLTDFMTKNKGVNLDMDVTNKTSVIRHLENNKVDFAMVSVIPDHLKLDRISLMKNKLYLVGKSDALASTKHTKKDFLKLPLILREEGSATRAAMEHFLSENDIVTNKKIILTSNEAVKQAVIAGLGFSVLPLIGIKNALANNDLQIIPMKGLPIITNWNLVWLSSKKLSPAATAFKEHITKNKADIIARDFSWFEAY